MTKEKQINTELVSTTSRIIREESLDREIEVGQWYWVTSENSKGKNYEWLGCIVHIGSNYVQIQGIEREYMSCTYVRVHLDQFEQCCRPETNVQDIIQLEIEKNRIQVENLMNKIRQITAGLAITPKAQLQDGGETQALAVRGNSQPVDEYKKDLVKAKDKLLPKIFEQIKHANERMAGWMKAPLIPLKAQAESLTGVTKLIENRIFNVEIYAGLIEEIVCIQEGIPASIEEPIHIFQRRAYMDEECLARYETGGMEFKDIEDFDQWIVKPENLFRLLPHPRCILAFRVRRNEKDRDLVNLSDFIRFEGLQRLDKRTFLYMRNGEQVFRLQTGIEFGNQLFPDFDQSNIEGKIYAKMFTISVDKVISEAEYLGLKEDYQRKRNELASKIRELRRQGKSKDHWPLKARGVFGIRDESQEYELYSPDSVYYDDITKFLQQQIDEHNRLVLVLQGLLDRSEVFHPHPPYQLWNIDGFNTALRLVYDDSRGLTTGKAIDFEEYRAQLNKSLKKDSVTVGQQLFWLKAEAEKENRRLDNDWRNRGDYRHKTFQPYNDPGPGVIAKISKFSKKGCTFEWKRGRKNWNRWGNNSDINRRITVPSEELLNISTYTPGDFHLFFDDARTRADYLRWAPLLLEAEEFYAGNRKVGE